MGQQQAPLPTVASEVLLKKAKFWLEHMKFIESSLGASRTPPNIYSFLRK